MDKLTQKIQKLNEIYHTMQKNYSTLKKMFRNHSSVNHKFVISEELLMEGYMLIKDKLETTETHKEFNRIIRGIK